ncbi:MAG: response regulator [Bacteroidota bacterium]|nr:response regulator [Bacteroidota bacterium]
MSDKRLLIVEDEQRLAEILQKQLEESGFKADVASDGYVGKRMIEQQYYDLIVLDINLPLMNGYELCKEIRKTQRFGE